jgi:hypothetical protein
MACRLNNRSNGNFRYVAGIAFGRPTRKFFMRTHAVVSLRPARCHERGSAGVVPRTHRRLGGQEEAISHDRIHPSFTIPTESLARPLAPSPLT